MYVKFRIGVTIEINRDRYLKRLIARKNNGMVKVVTGIRRCGKTYLLFRLFANHLRECGIDDDHIISIPLDAYENSDLTDVKKLHAFISDKIKDENQYYVLLDEIQLVEGFVPLLNSLIRMDNVDVYVTGSNSRMLSSDIATEFRGRGDEVRIRPLSFSEFFTARGGDSYDAMKEYMEYGGLPELVKMDDDEMKATYLRNLIDTVYMLDIKERFIVKRPFAMDNLVAVTASSSGSLVNITKLKNTMISMGYKAIDEDTIVQYISYIEDSYLFEKCQRYDVKGRKYMTTSFKMYSADQGLNNAKLGFRQMDDRPHIMENIIYNELRSRGFDVDIGMVSSRKNDGTCRRAIQSEIDFIARKGSSTTYIQSAYSIENLDEKEQELKPLKAITDSFRKIVIVNDRMSAHMDDNGFVYIGLIEFLMDEDSLSL